MRPLQPKTNIRLPIFSTKRFVLAATFQLHICGVWLLIRRQWLFEELFLILRHQLKLHSGEYQILWQKREKTAHWTDKIGDDVCWIVWEKFELAF